MSQKNLRKKRKGTPRAMPVETIITRFKSAQQKHQHEQKQNKSNKSKVQMRSKNKNKTSTPIKNIIRHVVDKKENKSLKELKEKEQHEEYYPEKLRRPLLNKKIVLAPKSSYKLVGSLNSFNKRKLRKPNKEIISPPKETHNFYCKNNEDDCDIFDKESDMSIIDSFSIGSDSLEEEDLLEILTCPSPVWWEDLPDDYDEGPISMKDCELEDSNTIKQQTTKSNEMVKEQNECIKLSIRNEQNDFKSTDLAINVNNRDRNFVNRRNKLEALLGNLKNKTTSEINKNTTELNVVENKCPSINNSPIHTSINNSPIHTSINNSPIHTSINNSPIHTSINNSPIHTSINNSPIHTSINNSPIHNRQKRASESCDEELLDDNFDDILRSFENIDIPIKNTSPEITKINSGKDTNSKVNYENAIKELKFDCEIKSPLTNTKPVKGITITKSDISKFKPSYKKEITNKIGQDVTLKKDKMLVMKNLSSVCDMKVLNKNDKNVVVHTTETNSFLNKEHQPSPVTGLTISNLDVQLMKPGNKNLVTKNITKVKLKSNNKDEEISQTTDELGTQSNNEIVENNLSDHVTVYQIVSEQETNSNNSLIDPKLDLNNEYNTQLSSYYNQCKNIKKNNKEVVNFRNKLVNSASDVNNPSVKSISLSDNETVKYCLQCSSIFDTGTCKYCATKLKSATNEHV